LAHDPGSAEPADFQVVGCLVAQDSQVHLRFWLDAFIKIATLTLHVHMVTFYFYHNRYSFTQWRENKSKIQKKTNRFPLPPCFERTTWLENWLRTGKDITIFGEQTTDLKPWAQKQTNNFRNGCNSASTRLRLHAHAAPPLRMSHELTVRPDGTAAVELDDYQRRPSSRGTIWCSAAFLQQYCTSIAALQAINCGSQSMRLHH
jgi:hypothetical protein